MHNKGGCVSAKPKDLAKAMVYAIGNMPQYKCVKLILVDGDSEYVVTQEELEAAPIKMLPPPTADRTRRIDFTSKEAEIAALKRELESLKQAMGVPQ